MGDDLKYHRKSLRLKGYDYSQPGHYFVTIVANGRECVFGEVVNGKMILNDGGKMVKRCWKNIPEHYPAVILDKYVIMPNHVHGIIIITNRNDVYGGVQNLINVGVQNFEPLQIQKQNSGYNYQQNKYQKIIPRSLGAIIRGFKIGVTKWFHENTNINKVWQRNFYDYIIRDKNELYPIRKYINNNPKNWQNELECL